MILILLLGGGMAGFVSALLGIGGAVILIPYLLTIEPLFGGPKFTPFEATEITIYQVLAAALVGYLSHRPSRLLPVRTLATWGGIGLVGSAIGGYLSHRLSGRFLLEVYLAEIFLALVLLFLTPRSHEEIGLDTRRKHIGPVLMGLIGGISGLLGIGGGFLYYPVMTGILGYSSPVAVGSSLGVMIPMALAGVIGKTAAAGTVPWETGPVVAGALAGAILGARLHPRLSPRTVRWGQALLLIATFARILSALL